jgi:putative redox protein
MITIETTYDGELRTRSRHVRSGTTIQTDAPPDNEGKGEYFSPTDLLSASLGTCMITVMGIAARKHKIDLSSARIEIEKIMHPAPRKVAEIRVKIFMNNTFSEKEKTILETAGRTCPVALSLHPELRQVIDFIYAGNEE